MLSGNGRHRRPRQAPALVVAAGVTGSAIAIPLLGATGASAADTAVDGTTWDRLAECESGGVWSADMGNGYYGGLQFTQATWENYGGLAYAPSANLASRAQQIEIAEKVLADQGPKAWSTCGPVAGLGEDAGAPQEPAPGESAPEDSTGSPDPADEPSTDEPATDEPATGDPSDEPTAEDPSSGERGDLPPQKTPSDGEPDDAKGSGESDGSGEKSGEKSHDEGSGKGDAKGTNEGAGETDNSGQNGSGRHRGEPAPEDPRSGRGDNSPGRHADRGDRGDRGDGSRGDASGTYTVRPGDNLSAIADARDIDGGWVALYDANEKTVGADPDLILPGQRLDLGEN